MSRQFAFAAAAVLFGQAVIALPVDAQPSDHDDPRYGDYFRSLRIPGKPHNYCCDESDCRSVASRFKDGHWEVFISRKEFGDENGTDTWEPVPNQPGNDATVQYPKGKIARPDQATACWYNRAVRCFDPPDLTN